MAEFGGKLLIPGGLREDNKAKLLKDSNIVNYPFKKFLILYFNASYSDKSRAALSVHCLRVILQLGQAKIGEKSQINV